MSIVRFILEFNVINYEKLQKLFQFAILNNNLSFAKRLVQHGVLANYKNDYALRYASEKGYYHIVKWLLTDHRDLINIHSNDDYALKWSCAYGHFKIVKLLIKYGASIYEYDNFALKWSAINGHIKIIKYLLRKNNFRGDILSNIIIKCAGFGKIDSIKLLKQSGGNIYHQDNDALLEAVNNLQYSTVKYLLINGADPTSKGNRCFYVAFKRGSYFLIKLIIKFILRLRPSYYLVNLFNMHSQYTLIKSIKWDNIRLIDLCLKYDADLSFDDYYPIKVAFRFSSCHLLDRLIEKSKINLNLDLNWDYLELAIDLERLDIVKLLVNKYKIDYNVFTINNRFNYNPNSIFNINSKIIKYLMGRKIWNIYKRWKRDYPIMISVKKYKTICELKLLPPMYNREDVQIFPGGELYREAKDRYEAN